MKNVSLRKYLKREKWLYLCSVFLVLLDGYLTFKYPQYLSNVVDVAIPEKNTYQLIVNITFMLVCQITSLIATIFLGYIFSKISNHFMIAIKSQIIEKVFKLDIIGIKNNKDTFISCMNNDLFNIEMIASRMIADFFVQVITIVVVVIVLLRIYPIILVYVIIAYPVLIIFQFIFNRLILKLTKDAMEYTDVANGLVEEFASYMKEYIVLDLQRYYIKKFLKNEVLLQEKTLNLNMAITLNGVFPQLISTIALITLIGLSGFSVINGEILYGEFVIIMIYTQKLFNPITSIMIMIGQFQKARISLKRIIKVGENYEED